MITQDEIKVLDTGAGYVIGEMQTQHKHLKYLKNSAIVCLFDGLDNMLDFITTKMKNNPHGSASLHSGGGDDDGFNAFNSYDEAMDTFRNHPEKVVKFDPSELRIKDESESGKSVDYNVTGDFIDMGRFMEGIPESVGTMHGGDSRNRRVSIVIDLVNAAHVHHEAITHRGERILRLIDALEGGGVRTSLIGIESSQCDHVEVILKRHEEPLTVTDLAVVTHPEFLRRACFRIIEHSKTFSYGYGHADVFDQYLKPELIESGNNDEIDIVIGGNFSNKRGIDERFDQLERLLVWEMSKPVPEVSSIKVDPKGVWFNPNGSRSDDEIRREGLEAINETTS